MMPGGRRRQVWRSSVRRRRPARERPAISAAGEEIARSRHEENGMGRVQDQVAVVTGAAHGLGRAIALRLAEEGARLALGDIDGPALDRTVADVAAKGGQAIAVAGDVTEEAPAARL